MTGRSFSSFFTGPEQGHGRHGEVTVPSSPTNSRTREGSMTAKPHPKAKIDLDSDLCGALKEIGKTVPRQPGERISYDRTIRWLIRTHPALKVRVVDELTLCGT